MLLKRNVSIFAVIIVLGLLATIIYFFRNNLTKTIQSNNIVNISASSSSNEAIASFSIPVIKGTFSYSDKKNGTFHVTLKNWSSGSVIKEADLHTDLSLVDGSFVGLNRQMQYNSATDSILFRADNYAGEFAPQDAEAINPRYDFCSAILRTDFKDSAPQVLIADADNCYSGLASWIVHPQLPLLFVVTSRNERECLTVIDIRDPSKREDFGPLPSSDAELRISSDGKYVYRYADDPGGVDGGRVKNGIDYTKASLIALNLASWELESRPLGEHPLNSRDDFSVSMLFGPDSFSPNGKFAVYPFTILDLTTGTYREIEHTEKYATWNVSTTWSSDSALILFTTTLNTPNKKNDGLNTHYSIFYDLNSDTLKELPLEPDHVRGFLPGTHKIIDEKGTYDVDTGLMDAFRIPRHGWQGDWVYQPDPTVVNFALSKTSASSSFGPKAVQILSLENIQPTSCDQIGVAGSRTMQNASDILADVGISSACIPSTFGQPVNSGINKGKEKGTKTVVRFKTVPDFSGSRDGLSLVNATYDFQPNVPEFEIDQSDPYYMQYATHADWNRLNNRASSGANILEVDGKKGIIQYQWLRTFHPPRLSVEKSIIIPSENGYLALLYRTSAGSGEDILMLQKTLESGKYPANLTSLVSFDQFVQSLLFK